MSGDRGAEIVVRAAKATLDKYSKVELILVGDEAEIAGHVTRIVGEEKRLSIRNATQVVGMSESPVEALRKKKDSSMRVAIDVVKDGTAQACVSAGNTGALMATSKFVLKMLPGVDRPAIIAELPAIGGTVHMLDLGANTVSTAEQLFQFAVMGSIVTADISNIERPRVALLNIGVEDIKGNDMVRDGAALLNASGLNYVGFIEGNEIFSGKADVVVTDGFTGNIALKTMEGTVGLASHYLRRAFTKNWLTKLQAIVAKSVLTNLSVDMDSRNYNGASLVGLNGIVIKSHGSADSHAFQHAIETAIVEVRNQVPQQIGNLLQREAA
ncbi:MAG: phosphate acyltransferase PlsX [Woeseia sp.]|jgi:phosphate acyltransferase|nr:phosphate acyltransferase PlsX [Woeseia sp.]MBT6211251.1 phosphate acyltransferase PlsX [Woeseia sp.]